MAKESSSSSSKEDSYIGSSISLISKYEIRYEGILYQLNTQDSTIGLTNVRSYGTEGRRKNGPEVPPGDKTYEYILFRGSDIKDLQVKSLPPAKTEEHIYDDPAIIQSHFATPSSSSQLAAVGVALTESSHYQASPPLTGQIHPIAPPLNQSASLARQSAHSQAAQYAGVSSSTTPMFWQGYNGTSIKIAGVPQQHPVPVSYASAAPYSSALRSQFEVPELQATAVTGLTNESECVAPVYSNVGSSSLSSNFPSTYNPNQSFQPPSSISSKPLVPPDSIFMSANRQTIPSFSSAFQDLNTTEAPVSGKFVSDSVSNRVTESVSYSTCSVSGCASGPLLIPPPNSLTLDILVQPRPPLLSNPQELYFGQRDMGSLTSSSAISTPALQMPLLPLPLSIQQSQYSTPQFSEEFDFEAMNQKFNKEEVWGFLGKAKQSDKGKGQEDNAVGRSMGESPSPNFDVKPAYNKDEFFDTISCNSHNRGGRGHPNNRFSERTRTDSQVLGSFHQRHRGSYGNYGSGRGENYQGSYNWGRGQGGYKPI